jgi:NADH:ubiquinone oxidoreductase subunit 4 (subunit M)
VLISVIGIVLTAAYSALGDAARVPRQAQRKYPRLQRHQLPRSVLAGAAPVPVRLLGVFPFFLLDWMDVSVKGLVSMLSTAGGHG